MIFKRSVPSIQYTDYTEYRPLLRQDFRYRCAYCLRHEGHNGGEANFHIDHFRPINGPFKRPDLKCVYTNLYYCCSECNENKADQWPDTELEEQGFRLLDPCQPEDDHDLHWQYHADGSMEAMTRVGKYTEWICLLKRPQLNHWRKQIYRLQEKMRQHEARLEELLSPEEQAEIRSEIKEVKEQIEPPIFDRPRGVLRRQLAEFSNDNE